MIIRIHVAMPANSLSELIVIYVAIFSSWLMILIL
jgi:hypothetical protein